MFYVFRSSVLYLYRYFFRYVYRFIVRSLFNMVVISLCRYDCVSFGRYFFRPVFLSFGMYTVLRYSCMFLSVGHYFVPCCFLSLFSSFVMYVVIYFDLSCSLVISVFRYFMRCFFIYVVRELFMYVCLSFVNDLFNVLFITVIHVVVRVCSFFLFFL